MNQPNQSELDEILRDYDDDNACVCYSDCAHPKDTKQAKQALLDWHNKQIEEVIKKPHILPKNAQHLESVKQGINFYHRQMRKRVDKLKEVK